MKPPISTTEPAAALTFLRTLHRDDAGELAIFSARRSKDRLVEPRTDYFTLPDQTEAAAAHAITEAAKEREVYACAHLLTRRHRGKDAAGPVTALWADGDLGHVPDDFPPPSLRVASSPGREQWYWHLTHPISPEQAENLNRRIAHLTGADSSGWDLGQLLRIPGTPNHKYPDAPVVHMLHAGPETYDPDDLDRQLPIPPPPTPTTSSTGIKAGNDGGVEPPVRLSAAGLAVWRGERFATKPDAPSEVDRSESLWRLACVLDEGGATALTIAAALGERDLALGWEKYTGRRDATEQYAAIVAKLAHRLRPPVPPLILQPAGEDHTTGGRVAELERRVAELEDEVSSMKDQVSDLTHTQAVIIETILNPNIKAEAVTAIRLATDVSRRRRRGEGPSADGFIRVSPAALGEDYDPWIDGEALTPIRGKSTINRHLQTFQDAGLIERDIRPAIIEKVVRDPETKRPIIDPLTGQPKRQRIKTEETWIRFGGESIAEILDPFARYRRPDPAPDAPAKAQHGGKRVKGERVTCPACGATEFACTTCGTIFEAPAAESVPSAVHHEPLKTIPPPVVSMSVVHDEPRLPRPAHAVIQVPGNDGRIDRSFHGWGSPAFASSPPSAAPPGEQPGADRWTS